MYPAGCATAIEVPIKVYIGQQEPLGELHPGKANAGQLARRAGGAVAADQPRHAHRVAVAEHREGELALFLARPRRADDSAGAVAHAADTGIGNPLLC